MPCSAQQAGATASRRVFQTGYKRLPAARAEVQVRTIRVLRVAHGYDPTDVGDLDACAAVVAAGALAPYSGIEGGDLDACAAVTAVGALTPCGAEHVGSGHPAPPCARHLTLTQAR